MTGPKKPTPPDGWRYLKPGELVQCGDVYANKPGGDWCEVDYFATCTRYKGRISIRWYARKKKERSK